ncbi:MAG: hypothetical protein SCH71_10245 [Desulfobulbaceae bacterium]|nr:hypothetical protein [Desulfobulbaceae bacterium]
MIRSNAAAWYIICLLLGGIFFMSASPGRVDAALPTLESRIISYSLESFDRRIYSYDMEIDAKGDVHIVYSKPYSDRKANIHYVRRIGGAWQPEILLTPDGYRPSGSTFLDIGSDNRIHVCYIKDEGTTPPSESLNYLVIDDGTVVKSETYVDGGGFHTRMQLDNNGYPVFVRGAHPGGVAKLALLTTTDGLTWDKSFLNLTQVPKFRLADFEYNNGTYHITYGDSAYTKLVWNGSVMTQKINGTFHDFYYITSRDGVNWTEHVIDNSHTLFEMEFWTALELVDDRPLIAMYKFAEYGNVYNRGTSVKLSEWSGSSWIHKIITNRIYADTSEGMGVGLAVNGPGDYFGAWDFSPSYPQILPPSSAGNTAMRRSGPLNDWSPIAQLDSFSLEGRARLRIFGGKLYFLALGDYTDPKLNFREYNIADLNFVSLPVGNVPPPGVSSDFPLNAVYHMLLNK